MVCNILQKNFYVSHAGAERYWRCDKKYYIYLVDTSNSFLFPVVKTFQNLLTVDEAIAEVRHCASFVEYLVKFLIEKT